MACEVQRRCCDFRKADHRASHPVIRWCAGFFHAAFCRLAFQLNFFALNASHTHE